ncbi:MAG: heme-binding domain-containing protein [Methylococcaceae bacterium]|nr:heme-binding domain-containing protein [Prolixibacteraceae bacterium]
MRNIIRIPGVLVIFSLVVFNFIPNNANCQSKTKEQTLEAFPDSMATIFKQSCVGCHHDQSKGKAKEFMNLSEWDRLSGKKQAKTARQINKQVVKGHMPPPDALKKFPQAALSAEQKQTIMAWSKAVRKNKGQ